MLKEKVNTHFSFPLTLNMSGYMEKNLIPSVSVPNNVDDNQSDMSPSSDSPPTSVASEQSESSTAQTEADEEESSWLYELIGVTVHTGTAEGGHYYSFIRERNLENDFNQNENKKPKW